MRGQDNNREPSGLMPAARASLFMLLTIPTAAKFDSYYRNIP